MEVEVLVHINARSRYVDDKRYKEIAQQVTNFEPATCLKLTSSDEHSLSEPLYSSICSDEPDRSSQIAMLPETEQRFMTDRVVQLDRSHRKRSFRQICEPNVGNAPVKRPDNAKNAFRNLPYVVMAPWSVSLEMESTDWVRAIEQTEYLEHGSYKLEATRAIKAWERGFWLIPVTISPSPVARVQAQQPAFESHRQFGGELACISWTMEDFSLFWKRLDEQIRAGQLGMVSLHRTGTSRISSTIFEERTSFGVRLYCWGRAVFHIHRALQLASPRLSDVANACWVGADGQTVVSVSHDPD